MVKVGGQPHHGKHGLSMSQSYQHIHIHDAESSDLCKLAVYHSKILWIHCNDANRGQ